MMRLASTHWMRREPLDRTVARLADAGYDAIVLDGDLDWLGSVDVPGLLARYGVLCHAVLPLMVGGYDLIDAHAEIRHATIQYLTALVRTTATLGGGLLSLAPCAEGRLTARASPQTEWQWAVDGLRRVADVGQSLGVMIGIEPVNRYETNFLNRHDQAIALAQAVGDGIGIILDTFHMSIEEADPYHALETTGPWLVDVQVADSNRLPPGQGFLDWPRILGILSRLGYDGYLTAEMVMPDDRSPSAWAARRDDSRLDTWTTSGHAEQRFLRAPEGFPLSSDAYTTFLRSAVTFLRPLLTKAGG